MNAKAFGSTLAIRTSQISKPNYKRATQTNAQRQTTMDIPAREKNAL